MTYVPHRGVEPRAIRLGGDSRIRLAGTWREHHLENHHPIMMLRTSETSGLPHRQPCPVGTTPNRSRVRYTIPGASGSPPGTRTLTCPVKSRVCNQSHSRGVEYLGIEPSVHPYQGCALTDWLVLRVMDGIRTREQTDHNRLPYASGFQHRPLPRSRTPPSWFVATYMHPAPQEVGYLGLEPRPVLSKGLSLRPLPIGVVARSGDRTRTGVSGL